MRLKPNDEIVLELCDDSTGCGSSINSGVMGIVGGFGPETSSKFHLDILRRCRNELGFQPKIVMSIGNISNKDENQIINGNPELFLSSLKECVSVLNDAGVDFIVIPCNTAHIFIDQLRDVSNVPIVSIVDETAKRINKEGFLRVGLLATSSSISNNLFHRCFSDFNISFVVPDNGDQNELFNCLHETLLTGKVSVDVNMRIGRIVSRLKENGADCIVLGCTDLQSMIPKIDLPVIDSLDVLADFCFEKIKGGDVHG